MTAPSTITRRVATVAALAVAMLVPAAPAHALIDGSRTTSPAAGTLLTRGQTITITGSAAAPVEPVPNVTITLPVPASTTVTGTSTPLEPGTVGPVTDPAGAMAGLVTATFLAVPEGSTARFVLTVTVDAGATKVGGPDNDITVGQALISEAGGVPEGFGSPVGFDLVPEPLIGADRAVTVGGAPVTGPVLPGTQLDVSYTIWNEAAPGDDATAVVLEDALTNLVSTCTNAPPLTCKVQGVGKTGAADGDELTATPTLVTASLGTLPGGASKTVTIHATAVVTNPKLVDSGVPPRVVMEEQLKVTFTAGEQWVGTARYTIPIATAALGLGLAPAGTEQDPTPLPFGTPGTATVTLSNAGPDTATGTLVRVSVTGGEFTAPGPAGCTVVDPSTYDCPPGAIAAGTSYTRSVTFAPAGIGPVKVTAHLVSSAAQFDRYHAAGADAVVWYAVGAASTILFEVSETTVAEDAGTVDLTVLRTGDLTGSATVDVARTGGTAGPLDAAVVPGTLSFAPGQATATVPVQLADDDVPEAAETVVVTLTDPGVGSVLGARPSTTLTIGASDQRPDLQVGLKEAGPFLGDAVYDPTGRSQTRTASVRRGAKRTFVVVLANDGSLPSTFTVTGSAPKPASGVRYLLGTTDVTAAMRSTDGLPVTLDPGETTVISVVAKIKRSARIGSRKPFVVSASWTGDGVHADAVRAVAKVAR